MRKHFEGCSALKLIVISPPMNERLFFYLLGWIMIAQRVCVNVVIYELPVHFMCNCISQPKSIRNYIYDFAFFDSLV